MSRGKHIVIFALLRIKEAGQTPSGVSGLRISSPVALPYLAPFVENAEQGCRICIVIKNLNKVYYKIIFCQVKFVYFL